MVKKSKTTITNFKKNDSFFFNIKNFLAYIYEVKNKNILKPIENEIKSMENKITEKKW